MNTYIQNKLDEFEDRYCKFEFCDTVSKPEMENYKKFLKQSLTEAYNKGQTDYHNHIVEKVKELSPSLKSDLFSIFEDKSGYQIGVPRNSLEYKVAIRDVLSLLQDTNPKE